jgi:hypothetical protein
MTRAEVEAEQDNVEVRSLGGLVRWLIAGGRRLESSALDDSCALHRSS